MTPTELWQAVLNYSPDEARDEQGRWTAGAGGAATKEQKASRAPHAKMPPGFLVFHGTTDAVLASIMKDGLVAGKGKGADEWAKKQGMGNFEHAKAVIGGRKASVYITENPNSAIVFANYASRVQGGRPIVLEIELPHAWVMQHKSQLYGDEKSSEVSDMRFAGRIPPEFIKHVHFDVPHVSDRELREGVTHNEGSLKYYMVLIASGKPTTNARRPTRLDPSRTGLLRRRMVAELRRRFARFKGALHKFLIRDDNLHFNAFCPTGVGGGVDPTCSPTQAKLPTGFAPPGRDPRNPNGPNSAVPDNFRPQLSLKEANAVAHYTGDKFRKEVNTALWRGEQPPSSALDRMLRGADAKQVHDNLQSAFAKLKDGPSATLQRAITVDDLDAFERHYASNKETVLSGYQSTSARSDSKSQYSGNLKYTIHATRGLDVGPYTKYPGEHEVLLNANEHYRVDSVKRVGNELHVELTQLPKPVRNAFCPTGPGGGVDPTCSPDETRASLAATRSSWRDANYQEKSVLEASRLGYATPLAGEIGEKYYLDKLGNTREAWNQVQTLFHMHTVGGSGQEQTDAEIVKALYEDSPRGKLLRDIAKTETALLREYYDGLADRNKIIEKRTREAHDNLPPEDIENEVEWAKEGPPILFRGGKLRPGQLESWTTNPNGAMSQHLGDVQMRFKVDHRRDVGDMLKEGYIALAGMGRMIGSPGESEVLMLKPTKPVLNYTFTSDPAKLEAFQSWLRSQTRGSGLTDQQLWQNFAMAGFKKGAARAYDDVKSKELKTEGPDFYRGSRAQFLETSFAQPETVDKVKLLASRSFSDMQGVTDAMSTRMSRVLADGLTQGKNPREIGSDLADEVDMAMSRATTIARTEVIRAHAEGQLDAMEDLGVTDVGVDVEFLTAGDADVCDDCAALEGSTFSVDDAHGVIPVHPNCRCCFIPAVGPTTNAFCPTGVGGGVDPTCSPHSAGERLRASEVDDLLKRSVSSSKVLDVTRQEAKVKAVNDVANRMASKVDAQACRNFNRIFSTKRGDEAEHDDDPHGTTANALVKAWAESSADSNPLALAVQRRAAELFSVKDHYDPGKDNANDHLGNTYNSVIDAFLKSTYENTQEKLKAAGIEYMQLARGTQQRVRTGEQNVQLQPLSSFSYSKYTAISFAGEDTGKVLIDKVPRERIFSTWATGPGCMPEQEVVVLGGTRKMRVLAVPAAEESHFKLKTKVVANAVFCPDILEYDWPKRTNDVDSH